jgi:clan AA aspartic protease (TIGR02281 family)
VKQWANFFLVAAAFSIGLHAAERIPLKDQGRGTYEVDVEINGRITLPFVLDSGASDVSIPADVASTLIRTGTLTKGDFLGSQTYETANGQTYAGMLVRIRSLKVGSVELRDIVASVSPARGSLLLGQSFLRHLQSWSIDNQNGVLIANAVSDSAGAVQLPSESTPPYRSSSESHPSVHSGPLVDLTKTDPRYQHCAELSGVDLASCMIDTKRAAEAAESNDSSVVVHMPGVVDLTKTDPRYRHCADLSLSELALCMSEAKESSSGH